MKLISRTSTIHDVHDFRAEHVSLENIEIQTCCVKQNRSTFVEAYQSRIILWTSLSGNVVEQIVGDCMWIMFEQSDFVKIRRHADKCYKMLWGDQG